MELFVLLFLIPLGLGIALALSIIALGIVLGGVILITELIYSLFQYIYVTMSFIGLIILGVISYYSPLLLFVVLLISIFIWLFPEPENQNKENGIPFVIVFNFFVLPLLIIYFYKIAEFDGVMATLLSIFSTLAIDVVLAIKRPNLVERNVNFLWLY